MQGLRVTKPVPDPGIGPVIHPPPPEGCTGVPRGGTKLPLKSWLGPKELGENEGWEDTVGELVGSRVGALLGK